MQSSIAQAFALPPEQWARLRQWLEEALALPAAERAAWLAGLGPEHPELQARLAQLLSQQDQLGAHRLLTLPRVETADFAAPPGTVAPERIGPYRLLRELGSGGMASVWLAERTDMLQARQVALKLPHGEWGSFGARGAGRRAGLAERLQREREILATLNHPNIATLFDAGVADDGQPWLALEYVEGERIDAHATRLGLGVPARLRLFVQVARAVAHAHAQLVVHRDLKPGNILVTPAGQVKLLDFGIAKLLDQGLTAETELTQHMGRALTPQYASPEQLRGDPIGTASDVYALGVVLFELLTGRSPYGASSQPALSRAALEQAVQETPAPRPSQRAPDATTRQALHGDLDTIVLHALGKEPAARYSTVDALADDIERHLEHRPVRARPDTAAYRLHKLVARNRVATAALAAVVLALLGGAGVATWQARLAIAEARRAEEVKSFIARIFEDANPSVGPQNQPTAAELLRRARQRLGSGFADQPLIRIELLNTLGSSLLGLQALADAQAVLAEAELLGEALPAHPLALRTRMIQLDLLQAQGRTAELKQAVDAVLPRLRANPAANAADLVMALMRQAEVANQASDYVLMEQHARAALAVVEQHLGPEHRLQISARQAIGNALENQGKGAESVAFAQQAFERAERQHATQPLHPQLSELRYFYARVLFQSGERQRALPLWEQAIADSVAVFGNDAPRVATMRRALVAPLVAAHRLGDALVASDQAMPVLQTLYAPQSEHLAYAHVARGSIYAALRQPERAHADFDAAIGILQTSMAPDAAYPLHVRAQRAVAAAHLGQPRRAAEELALIVQRQQAGKFQGLWFSVVGRAVALRLDQQHAAALALLAEHEALAQQPQQRQRLNMERGLNLLALGQAATALAALQTAQDLSDRAALPLTPQHADLALALGRALLAQGQADAARAHLARAESFWRAHAPGGVQARDAARWLARAG